MLTQTRIIEQIITITDLHKTVTYLEERNSNILRDPTQTNTKGW